jgi:hypothetical protein
MNVSATENFKVTSMQFAPDDPYMSPTLLPSSPSAAERTTPRLFKQERQGRDKMVASGILNSRRLVEGSATGEVVSASYTTLTSPISATPEEASNMPTSDVAAAIRTRGIEAMSRSSPKGRGCMSCEFDAKPTDVIAGLETSVAASCTDPLADIDFLATDKADDVSDDPVPQAAFDSMTIPFSMSMMRELFTHLDDEGTGHISKNQWVEFFRQKRNLRKLLLKDEEDGEDDARIMRKLLRQLKEVDLKKNGFVDWEAFISYFQRSGYTA